MTFLGASLLLPRDRRSASAAMTRPPAHCRRARGGSVAGGAAALESANEPAPVVMDMTRNIFRLLPGRAGRGTILVAAGAWYAGVVRRQRHGKLGTGSRQG